MKTAAERYDEATVAAMELAALRAQRSSAGSGYRHFLREEMRAGLIAEIEAAIAEERARCAAVARNWKVDPLLDIRGTLGDLAEAIERGDEPERCGHPDKEPET